MNPVPLLSLVVFAPFAGAVLLAALRGASPMVCRCLSLVFSFSTLALGLVAVGSFEPTQTDYQFVERYDWITALNVHYHLGLDGLSLLLVLLTSIISPAALFASSSITRSPRLF